MIYTIAAAVFFLIALLLTIVLLWIVYWIAVEIIMRYRLYHKSDKAVNEYTAKEGEINDVSGNHTKDDK